MILDLLPRNQSTFCRIGNAPVLIPIKTKMKAGVDRTPDSLWRDIRAPSCLMPSTRTRLVERNLPNPAASKLQQTCHIGKGLNICTEFALQLTLRRTNEPVCPSGSFFSMLCQAAHLGAAAEDRTLSWVPSDPDAFFLRGDPHIHWTDGVDDDPAAGRVYGDSGCSGHRTEPPSPAHSCLSRTEIGSYLQADRQRHANFTVYLQTNAILCSD